MARAAENLGAVGIGVSDLAKSEDFYTRVLGMSVQQRIDLPHLKEVVVGYEGRTSVVLMHWIDGSARNYKDAPVKLVFFVTDPTATAQRIRDAGGTITLEPGPHAAVGGAIVGMAKDPDGYVIELLPAPEAKAASPAAATAEA
jgi:lactoylglutathione lyase